MASETIYQRGSYWCAQIFGRVCTVAFYFSIWSNVHRRRFVWSGYSFGKRTKRMACCLPSASRPLEFIKPYFQHCSQRTRDRHANDLVRYVKLVGVRARAILSIARANNILLILLLLLLLSWRSVCFKIWSEYRVHNIAFGVRSVITAGLAWLSYYKHHAPLWRRFSVWGSAATVILALFTADLGTHFLRVNNMESTTATMPYWEGCSVQTQKRFKTFYAYCQFLATLACLAVGNPAWPLSVLVAIQLASLLMTLVRKGFLSTRGYHIGYTTALIMPWLVGFRSLSSGPDFLFMTAFAWVLYQLRRRGINKYVLWGSVICGRIALGDRVLHWSVY